MQEFRDIFEDSYLSSYCSNLCKYKIKEWGKYIYIIDEGRLKGMEESFFFLFLFLKQEINENVFPFYGLHFRALAELCYWTRSLENKELWHFRWKFEKLKLKDRGRVSFFS